MINKNTIEVGDLVCLHEPYKNDDYRHSKNFLAALNDGIIPQGFSDRNEVYKKFPGFTHGIVHQVLNTKIDGTPHQLALYLYYPQKNGVWLMYGYAQGIPICVDFNAEEVELFFKSSATDYNSGRVNK